MHRDLNSDRPRRSIGFWAPVLVFGAVVGGIGSFYYGQLTKEAQRAGEDKTTLAVMAMRSPSEALESAERQLMADRIDFSVYRDLLQAALSRSDYQVRNVAYQSIHRVAVSGRGYGERLKKWLPSLPTEVFITTSDKGAVQDVEEKLKRRGSNVVIQEDGRPIRKTQVFCYDQDVCKQTAPSVVNLLREAGYSVEQAKLGEGIATSSNRIDIQLAAMKAIKPVKTAGKPSVAKPRRHPNEAPPVVAENRSARD
jgi:hypothetical protein